jgi:hypothetical protein
MGLLTRRGFVPDPQILIGAIGDATCDRVPLQVGQFESDNKIEDDLGKLFLEGGGGGHITESYELGMYFMARHTALDCLEKRNRRGYLFFIGDETPYENVDSNQIQTVIGDSLQDKISTRAILEELKAKYDVYFILPKMTAHYDQPAIWQVWQEYLGQNLLRLEDPDAVSELIASTVALCEGTDLDSVTRDLADVGAGTAASAISRALAPLAAKGTMVHAPSSGAASGLMSV